MHRRQGKINKSQSAAEEERVHGIGDDYGGYEVAIEQCAYPISYGSAALAAGAPRR